MSVKQGPRDGDGYGPGYIDVEEATRHIWDVHCYRCLLQLVPPVRTLDGRGFTSWGAKVRIEPRLGVAAAHFTGYHTFGKGGEYRTAPAALHAAVLDVLALLREREQMVAKQAAF